MRHVATIFSIFFLSLTSFLAIGQSREESTFGGQQPIPLIKIFPNPAIEYLHIRFEEPIAKQSRLTVHNIIGNILEVERESVDDHEFRLKVKDLPAGYYLLALTNETTNSKMTVKFLKR